MDAISFNSDVSSWNVTKVIDMNHMFSEARSFNQSLCAWYTMLNATTDVNFMLKNTGCSEQADPILGVYRNVSRNATRSDPSELNFCTPCYIV